MTLPDNLISRTLNAKARREERGQRKQGIPRLHVSSLIKSGPADFFCEREFVLRYFERRDAMGGGIPAKFQLLFAVGHFYGEYIVQTFLERNEEYAQYAWGDWNCLCKESLRTRQCKPVGQICNKCGTPVDRYVETDLFDPLKRVVGHADLILFKDGIFYIYEFKSIERADIVFNEINEPLGDHLLQASNYYYMLKAEGHKVSSKIRFVYVDRSMSGLYTELPFREVYGKAVSPERLAKIYDRSKRVHKAIKSNTLPERKCADIECSRAKTCSVAISCFNRHGTKITLLDSMPVSRPLGSTSGPSVRVTGSASQSAPTIKKRVIRRASSPSAKK